MKQLLTILLTLACFASYGQKDDTSGNYNHPLIQKGGWDMLTFARMPVGCAPYSSFPKYDSVARYLYDTCLHQIMVHDGSEWTAGSGGGVDSGGITSLTITSPLTGGHITTTGTIGIQQASTVQAGYVSALDWNTFNNKQPALSGTGFVKISGTTISYDNTTYYPFSNPSGFISTELDPVFTASIAHNITAVDTTHYNLAWLKMIVSGAYSGGTATFTRQDGTTFTVTGFNAGTVTQVVAGAGLSGGTITTTGTISMPNTGSAGTYGSATQCPVTTYDAQGRETSVTNTTITPAWGSITGTPTTLAGYGVTAVAWSIITGTPTTLSGYGITDAYTKTVSDGRYAPISVTGTVTSVTAGTGLSGGVITSTGTISMPNVGTAGTYGGASAVPIVTTDAQGRVSGVTTVNPSVATVTGTLPIAHGGTGATTTTSVNAVPFVFGANNVISGGGGGSFTPIGGNGAITWDSLGQQGGSQNLTTDGNSNLFLNVTGNSTHDIITGYYHGNTGISTTLELATGAAIAGATITTNYNNSSFDILRLINGTGAVAFSFPQSGVFNTSNYIQVPYGSGYGIIANGGGSDAGFYTFEGDLGTNIKNSYSAGHIGFFTSKGVGNTFNEVARFATSGNLLLNTTTDDGVNQLQVSGSFAINSTKTPVSGSTSGTATFAMPQQGTSRKLVTIHCSALLGTATYTFPTAFVNTPSIIYSSTITSGIVTTLTTTSITLTGVTTTGYLEIVEQN